MKNRHYINIFKIFNMKNGKNKKTIGALHLDEGIFIKVGIVSDEKYGDKAFENINHQ